MADRLLRGKRLYLRGKFERLSRGWTQEDLAIRIREEGVNITQNDISGFERGRVNLDDDELEAMARVFCISPPSVLTKPCAIRDPEEEEVAS